MVVSRKNKTLLVVCSWLTNLKLSFVKFYLQEKSNHGKMPYLHKGTHKTCLHVAVDP